MAQKNSKQLKNKKTMDKRKKKTMDKRKKKLVLLIVTIILCLCGVISGIMATVSSIKKAKAEKVFCLTVCHTNINRLKLIK